MIYRTDKAIINNYYSNLAISQSGLKVILSQGVQKLIEQENPELYYEEKTHFILGKAIDCYITEGKEEFERNFFISSLYKKPSDTIMSVLKYVFDRATLDSGDSTEDLNEYQELIYESLNVHEYFLNRKKEDYRLDTRVSGILKDSINHQYWNELLSSAGKQILSDKEKDIILGNTLKNNPGIVNSILLHSNTRTLFNPDYDSSHDIDIVYQYPIFKPLSLLLNIESNIQTKALLDMILIDHSRKVIRPLDIKTMGDYVINFNQSLKARRYDIQAKFYTDMLSLDLENLSTRLRKDIRDYKIANFAFIVESTVSIGFPMIFPLSNELLEIGKNGDGKFIKGYIQALSEYKRWYDVNFDLSKLYPSGILFIEEGFQYRT